MRASTFVFSEHNSVQPWEIYPAAKETRNFVTFKMIENKI